MMNQNQFLNEANHGVFFFYLGLEYKPVQVMGNDYLVDVKQHFKNSAIQNQFNIWK